MQARPEGAMGNAIRFLRADAIVLPVAKPRENTDRRAVLTLLPTWQAVGLAQEMPVRCAAVAAS